MSETRFISPDITAALDRWVVSIGTPDHQAAVDALDDILEGLCEDREAWGQALTEKHQVERALIACAAELDRKGVELPPEFEDLIRDTREEHAKIKASAERTRDWLAREGFAIAAAARDEGDGTATHSVRPSPESVLPSEGK